MKLRNKTRCFKKFTHNLQCFSKYLRSVNESVTINILGSWIMIPLKKQFATITKKVDTCTYFSDINFLFSACFAKKTLNTNHYFDDWRFRSSYLSSSIISKNRIPEKFDFLHCYRICVGIKLWKELLEEHKDCSSKPVLLAFLKFFQQNIAANRNYFHELT